MKTATYSADFKNLDSIRNFVGEAAKEAGFSGKDVYAIELATDEACSNVIEHAYKDTFGGEIEISCDVTEGQISITIHDHGKTFDVSSVRPPNLSHKLSEREIGGLGVYLIRKLMDEVEFLSSPETGNTLTMKKRKAGQA